jgi:hypothetical protein
MIYYSLEIYALLCPSHWDFPLVFQMSPDIDRFYEPGENLIHQGGLGNGIDSLANGIFRLN